MRILDVVDKNTLTKLYQTSNFRASIDLFIRIYVSALLFTLSVILIEYSLYASLTLFYAYSIWHSFWGYAGIGHEFFHRNVFSNKLLNKIFFRISSYLTWNNSGFFENSHRYHHANTFEKNDSEGLNIQKWNKVDIFLYLTIDILLFFRKFSYALINSFGFTIFNRKFNKLNWRCQSDAILMLLFNTSMQCLIAFTFNNFIANIFWFIAPFTAQFINRLFAQSQHIGLKNLKSMGPLNYSRTLQLPKVFEFLYAGMNFHAEHHLAPGIPYYNLPKLNQILLNKNLVSKVNTFAFFKNDIWLKINQS